MDEIIVISGGRAIERGSHAELLARNGSTASLGRPGHKPSSAYQVDDDSDDEDDEDDDDGAAAGAT